MRNALLIYNPAAGRGRLPRRLPRVLTALKAGGFGLEVLATRGPGDATMLAREATHEGRLDVVFALGGDGTVREVTAGLLGTQIPVGILPGGTVNVLARTFGLPNHPVRAAALMPRLIPRPMDVGLCGGKPFLMMASAGLDAAILSRVKPRWKRRLGRAAVLLAGLMEWWRYSYPEIEILAEGESLRGTLVVAANIPYYGGRFQVAPGARWDDGELDLVLFTGRGRVPTLHFALDLVLGRHLRRPDITRHRVRRLTWIVPAGASAQIDGDPRRRETPLHLSLAQESARVLGWDAPLC